MAKDEAAELAASRRGAMVAPAGCGKTHVIARAVAEFGGGRELILTHTHAGVAALRARLVAFRVPQRDYRVDTIAGWALRLATAFPATSGLPSDMPRENEEYQAVYTAAAELLRLRSIAQVVRSSYTGVYVDEYQDCTLPQHSVVLALRNILPCRVVGDPLQGIFDFAGQPTVRWRDHVESDFDDVPGPRIPWRWRTSNPKLGEWLSEVRRCLEQDPPASVSLDGAPVKRPSAGAFDLGACQRTACYGACRLDQSVVAIHNQPAQSHAVARQLGGKYSCVEPIDAPDLQKAAQAIDASNGYARAIAVIDFAGAAMTGVKTAMGSVRNAFAQGRIPRVRTNVDQADALQRIVEDDAILLVKDALRILRNLAGVRIYRDELLRDMSRAIDLVAAKEASTLADAVWLVRNQSRQRGRILPQYSVGTPLLIKGLEFDHAIVLEPGALKARSLYVALTRGSKVLTVLSDQTVLAPSPGC